MKVGKKLKKEYCYWCGNEATTREHVPPKCLFPENKDTENYYKTDFRKNLITVPSCLKHNTDKSGDDEYFFNNITPLIGNNDIAYIHSHTKLSRSYIRNPNLIDVKKEGYIFFLEPEKINLAKINIPRIKNSLESISRALYFHENNTFFKGTVFHASKFLNSESNLLKILESEYFYWNQETGDNKRIFFYQKGFPISTFSDNPIELIYKLVFYENATFYTTLYN